MILLLDIGNTNTHLGLANGRAVTRQADIPTRGWRDGTAARQVRKFSGKATLQAVAVCSVVPRATAWARREMQRIFVVPWFELTAQTARRSLRINYPRPDTIGPDRLCNAIAASHHYGAPCLAIGFGTAATFNVVDGSGHFVGGAIAPGLSLMTGYLHEKTALLPAITIRPVRRAIGRSTGEAMRSAAVHGYRGLVRELIRELKRELGRRRLPVIATGAYARFIASDLPEITAVEPLLTLEGLRLACLANLKLETSDRKPTLRQDESH